MKYIILIIIIFIVLYGYRLFQIKYKTSNMKKNQNFDERIIDLEKDPKTKEYKPKE